MYFKMLRVLPLLMMILLWPMSVFSEEKCNKALESKAGDPTEEQKKPTTNSPTEQASVQQANRVLDTLLSEIDFELTNEERTLFLQFLEKKNIRTIRDLKDRTTKPYLRLFLSRKIVYKLMNVMYHQYHIVIPEF